MNDVAACDNNNDMNAGKIPAELSQLASLKGLNLSHNKLSGDSFLQQQLHLTCFIYTIAGNIPFELSQLCSLEVLYLNNNNLTGESVQLFLLERCVWRKAGRVPGELAMLSKLCFLTLGGNILRGRYYLFDHFVTALKFTHSLTHSLAHSITHSFTQSLTHAQHTHQMTDVARWKLVW